MGDVDGDGTAELVVTNPDSIEILGDDRSGGRTSSWEAHYLVLGEA